MMRPKSELKIIGEYYGFPSCCVDWFLGNHGTNGWQDYIKNTKFSGTGYVPCPVCGQEKKSTVVRKIRNNRKHPRPFPDSDCELMAIDLGLEV